MMRQPQPIQPQQFVLAIRPHDGKLLWKAEVGTFRQASQRYNPYGMADTSAQPKLTYRAGSIYVDTHSGILARLDAETGDVAWGYGYPTEAVQSSGGRMFIINGFLMSGSSTASASSTTPLTRGDALIVKGAKASRICAIDPDRMTVLWERPIARNARLLGADDRAIYLGGPELGAIDPRTRALLWSTRLPGGSEEARVLVRPDGLWQFTPRGIFEVDPVDGRVRRIFRGDDPGANGGDLLLTDRWLLAVSNQSITAYPLTPAVAGKGGADE